MKQPEYKGKKFSVLHDEGGFQLIETLKGDGPQSGQVSDISWVFHLCESYTRSLIASRQEPLYIGLMSDKEMWREKCSYCQLRIPENLMGLWKMMNWSKAEIVANWDEDMDMP